MDNKDTISAAQAEYLFGIQTDKPIPLVECARIIRVREANETINHIIMMMEYFKARYGSVPPSVLAPVRELLEALDNEAT